MKMFNSQSALPMLFVAVLLTAFGGGRFAVAQDGSALEIDVIPVSCQVELVTPDGIAFLESYPDEYFKYFLEEDCYV